MNEDGGEGHVNLYNAEAVLGAVYFDDGKVIRCLRRCLHRSLPSRPVVLTAEEHDGSPLTRRSRQAHSRHIVWSSRSTPFCDSDF